MAFMLVVIFRNWRSVVVNDADNVFNLCCERFVYPISLHLLGHTATAGRIDRKTAF